MEINLSKEMIKKICRTSASDARAIRRTIKKVNEEEITTQRQQSHKMLLLKELNKALADAEEVNNLFLQLLNEIKE